MASKTIYFVLLIVAFSLVVDDAEAGWKFWKKKKDDGSTTVAPGVEGEAVAGAAGSANPAGAASPAGAAESVKPATGSATPALTKPPGATGTVNPSGAIKPAAGSAPPAAAKPAPAASNPASNPTAGTTNSKPGSTGPAPGSPSTGVRGAIAGAANPGLAIGVGDTGTNIRNNARPSKPNPGTDVGLDIGGPRPVKPATGPAPGQSYGAWAADLTGAGEGRQPPKVPSQGPASNPSGTRPTSLPNSPTSGQSPNSNKQGPPALGPRPGSTSPTGVLPGQQGSQVPSGQPSGQPSGRPVGQPTGQPAGRPVGQPTGQPAGQPVGQPSGQPAGQPAGRPSGQGLKPEIATPAPAKPNTQPSDGTQISTLNIGSLNPGKNRPGSIASGSSGYGSPGNSQPGSPTSTSSGSPTGGKTWADIAATNSKPGSPGSPTPGSQPGSQRPGQTAPGGRPISNGAAVAGGALAGGAAVATAGAAASGRNQYSANPTYSKGNTVTDEDLEKLAEALFIKDTNNANRYITLNLQKQTTSDNAADQAPKPLMVVDAQVLKIPTIAKVLTIYDNYKPDTRVNEYISPAQRNEESQLVDTFLATNVMSAAMRFLADKGLIRKDYYDYKDVLRTMWFNLYSRGEGRIGSSGFEHVFLTELKLGTEVIGLHNWIYFNTEEIAKRADYLGYIKKVDLGNKAAIVKVHAKYNNFDKPVTTMFIGTSPELEMALYTVCFYARPDSLCPVSLGGTKFNIRTHKFRYRGKDLIGSAYPEI